MNQAGFDASWPLIEVAVRSALDRKQLVPICLYNGTSEAQAVRIAALGVRVTRHRSRLEAILRQGYGDRYDQFSGRRLRVAIPQIETL